MIIAGLTDNLGYQNGPEKGREKGREEGRAEGIEKGIERYHTLLYNKTDGAGIGTICFNKCIERYTSTSFICRSSCLLFENVADTSLVILLVIRSIREYEWILDIITEGVLDTS